MSQDNKWYLMTTQSVGVSNMFKGSGKPESGLYSSNSCQVTVEQGKQLGIRVMFIRGKIRTEIMDNNENVYRYCQEVDMVATDWEKYYFGVATKNVKNLNKEDMITDIDIQTILFSLFDEEQMPV
jgi:hypothetical protein